MRKLTSLTFMWLALIVSPAIAQTEGSVEDVQIASIDFDRQVLELRNFGSQSRPLDGWRFCTHDEGSRFRYSSSVGLNGVSLAAGESLLVHWLDDASAANAINRSTIGGGWINELSTESSGTGVAIGIYRSGAFGSAASLVDHVQYSFEGEDVTFATPRTGVAVQAELWSGLADWVAIADGSSCINLVDDPFPGAGSAHGPASYDECLPASEEVFADEGMINVGLLLSGAIEDLALSDNVDLSVRRNTSSFNATVEVEIKGQTAFAKPSTLSFTFEGSVFARTSVSQRLSLFNYETMAFEEIDVQEASRFIDRVTTIEIAQDAARFVDPATGCVEARIRFVPAGNRAQYTVNMDNASWTIVE